MPKPRRLDDAFRFPGFRPEATVRGIFGDVNGGGKVQRGAGADGRPKWATPLV
jgi:hypothetical protein